MCMQKIITTLTGKVIKSDIKTREKWNYYMRERRRKIKEGIIIPVKFQDKTLTKNKNYQRDYQRAIRKRALQAYGSKCKCCGETTIEFLAFDHVLGGGNEHRKITRNTAAWVIQNNFPDNIQILCHNCNMAKGIYGLCPHNKK